MKKSGASIRYAKALFRSASDTNKSREVLLDLNNLFQLLQSDSQLETLIFNPVIKKDVKASLIRKIFDTKISNLSLNFLLLLIKKGREAFLLEIINKYKEIYNTHNNISVLDVVSVNTLSDVFKERLKEKISGGGEVILNEKIDKNLIGGFIIKKGDLQYDASIRKQLNNAKRAFKL